MNFILDILKPEIYDKCNLQISNFEPETESEEYDASRFELNGLKIISRLAKQTPKKVGQFVTFWKRNESGVIEPFHKTDQIKFFVINIASGDRKAQFVFPETILRKQGIIATESKEGKRGFRVYPEWEKTDNKQAIKTQSWQLDYFYEINDNTDLEKVKLLYSEV